MASLLVCVCIAPLEGQQAATALTLSDPSSFPAARSEREKIEAAIIRGDPLSLDNADMLIGKSRMLSIGELGNLKAVVAVFREILYPDPAPERSTGAGTGEGGRSTDAPAGIYSGLDQEPAVSQGSAVSSHFSSNGLSSRLADLLVSLQIFGSDGILYQATALDTAKSLEGAGIISIFPELLRGKVSEIAGDQKVAAEHYLSAYSAFPTAWPAALGLERCRMSLGLYAEAAMVVDALDPGFGSIPQVLALSAQILHENARLSEAYVLASRHLEYVPADPRSRMIRAHYLVESGEYPIALGILAGLPKPESSSRLYFELRSLVSQGVKNIKDMLVWAKKGLDLYPDDPGLLVLAAKALYSGPESGFSLAGYNAERALTVLGVATSAIATPAIVTVENPPPPLTPAPTAGIGTLPGSFLSASVDTRSPLEKARLLKASREASRLLIVASTSGSNWNDALVYMDLAGQISVDRKTQASILRNSGKIPDAILYSQTWYREEPESGDALEAWLRSLALAGRMEEVRVIISGLPSGGGSSHQRAYLLYLRGRMASDPVEAMHRYRDALFEEANNVDALVALAEVHLGRKEMERAVFYYNQAAGTGTTEKELSLRLSTIKTNLDEGK